MGSGSLAEPGKPTDIECETIADTPEGTKSDVTYVTDAALIWLLSFVTSVKQHKINETRTERK